jgi:hypothetical protein
MTEKQKYSVIRNYGEFETRLYDAVVLADVVVQGARSAAGNQGFGPLFNYISTNKIAMTAPVIQEERENGHWVVSFVMPADRNSETLPIPAENSVKLREVKAEEVAVMSFSGGSSESLINKKEAKLRSLMSTYGLVPNGNSRVARFNPPWIPTILRHNEILILYSS